MHFRCIVIDGVFDTTAAGGVVFLANAGLDGQRVLRSFVQRGLLAGDNAPPMGQWNHGGGFSMDGSVRIEAADRAGRERLLRYCISRRTRMLQISFSLNGAFCPTLVPRVVMTNLCRFHRDLLSVEGDFTVRCPPARTFILIKGR